MKFNKKQPYGYILLITALFVLMSMQRGPIEKIRGLTMAAGAPVFQGLHSLKHTVFGWFSGQDQPENLSPYPKVKSAREEMQRLRTENRVLTAQLIHTRELLESEIELRYYIDTLKEDDDEAFHWLVNQSHNRHTNLLDFLTFKLRSVPARVFFRSPGSWNSSIWIDVGTEDNDQVVAKNSAVLSGESIIGVIDYAGKHQSRVRLITDSGLTPSVRAVRRDGNKILHLAKGELQGSSLPLWRGKSQELQGLGFNYDFADAEGPARDLRTGESLNPQRSVEAVPIIQVNDLLITTGMDGVFPPGLSVATVTDIDFLKEGDYTYTITAVPTAENLDELSLVFIIPPYGYDPDEQPPHVSY